MSSTACDIGAVRLEIRPLRPFKSSEEYLWAMKEDLAEWLNTLYDLKLTAESFLDALDDGVVLCRHANKVLETARLKGQTALFALPERDVVYRADVQRGTFQARDNVSNFIAFCRALNIKECLLFETEDLVMRKNERSFILCLLEVARRGARVGMLAPLLVQFEQEIDAELEDGSSDEDPTPRPQIITNDLRSLHERVVDLLNRCTCPSQFPMIRVADGKYRIGDTKVLIFVRILRTHVMVRVGGGWDTLEHYLDKHDPCRCRSGHRTSISARLTMTPSKNGPAMQVTYNRPQAPTYPYESASPITTRRSLPNPRTQPLPDPERDAAPSRNSHCSDDSSSSGGCCGPADSSSETSESEFKAASSRKCSPRKIPKTGPMLQVDTYCSNWKTVSPERPDSGLAHESSETSSVVSTDDSNQDSAKPATNNPKQTTSKSRIPCLAAPPQRANSIENVSTNGRAQHSQPTVNGRPRQSSMPPSSSARRKSADPLLAPLPRSRSHSSDGGMLSDKNFFPRATIGRSSWKSPPPPRSSRSEGNGGNKTWAFKQRNQRTPLTPDLFSNNLGGSPTRAQRPNAISPLLQELLSDRDLDSDDKLLKKMEYFVSQYRARLDECEKTKQFSANDGYNSNTLPRMSHTAPTSPDSFRSPPCRRRGSKIPMATYYGRD
ncbi:GAS2-like protein pickled eggs [Ornithodoros turicata]|uniref:Putative microtubule n=1 Tax=Ornithodoros turicata TaxID=34597 RepID=A0A2R5LMM6_9ACAR